MIGLLRGRIVQRQPPSLLLEVNGVGYEVEAPMSTFYDLPTGDEPVVLYTHLMVRDDAHTLFGFVREGDRALFRMLLRVNGVGGKMALAILSAMTAEEFALNVEHGDAAALTRIPGVGKKTAERLLIEMRDRLEGLGGDTVVTGAVSAASAGSADGEAVEALVALGYRPAEAARLVKAAFEPGMETEAVIRAALKGSSR
jgi:Holliday junction DNA helicase RuvA